MGLFGAPVSPGAPGVVRGDELADAKARQAQIKKDMAAQAEMVAKLTALQGELSQEIKNTAGVLKGINADLAAVKIKITSMEGKIDVIRGDYNQLVVKLQSLDANLVVIEAQEVAKKTDLAVRKKLLAERLRSAYDSDRTSLLETFLSGSTFTDMLTEMSYYIDVGEQDKALANEISQDQATLAALHQATEDTRSQTNDLRQQTAAQKRALDQSLRELNASRGRAQAAREADRRGARLAEADVRRHRAQQGGRQGRPGQGRGRPEEAQGPDRRAHPQAAPGRQHPVALQRHADLADERRRDPELRLHRVLVGAALRVVPHFHQGIDIVAPYGTPVKASGDGTVVYIGWNYADGADPAWIVIIAHSDSPPDLVRAHAAALPGRDPCRQRRVTVASSSATKATRAIRPAPTSTGP